MSVADCLARSVAAGAITQKTADSAQQMHQRMQREFTPEMGPASADAAAALEAAKTLRTQSAAKIRNAAQQIRTFRDAETRMKENPFGGRGALIDTITRSLWRDSKAFQDLPDTSLVKTGGNVEGKAKAISRQLTAMLGVDLEKLKPGLTGFTEEQKTTIENINYELRGVATGDQYAATFAKGWAKMGSYAVNRAQLGGKIFTPLEDWISPQMWRNWRVRDFGREVFKADRIAEADSGAMTIFDRDTGKPVTLANRDNVLNRAFDDIVHGGGQSQPLSRESRTFNYAQGKDGADAWMAAQKKNGAGSNILQMWMNHIDRTSRELALIEQWGPSYEANFAAAKKMAARYGGVPAGAGAPIARFNPARAVAKFVENEGTLEGVWKVATGRATPAHDDWMSGLTSGLKNLNAASALHQAVITVVPSDTVTHAIAAGHMGMDPIAKLANILTPGALSKEDAAHFLIQSHNALDFGDPLHDFNDKLSLLKATGVAAKTTVRATGLEFMSQRGKRIWAGDMLNFFAKQLDIPFDRLDPRFSRFLSSYGFDAADWAKLQGMNRLDLNGPRYLDLNDLSAKDERLYERISTAIDEQGAFAMHQPDYRIRAMETGAAFGAERGTAQNLWRSFMQFKTFALSRMTTHMMRMLTDGDMTNRAVYAANFLIFGMASSMASLQALQIVNGKDLRDMTKASFWGEAFVKTGMAGYYGDVIASLARGDRSMGDAITALGGPTMRLLTDAGKLAWSPVKEEFDPDTGRRKQNTIGRQVTSILSRNTPSTWYTKLAFDRLIWDKLQTLIDPDYRKSWRRIEKQTEKDSGANFFWPRGESLPTRAPALGTALGQ